jgi:hypothetical protein
MPDDDVTGLYNFSDSASANDAAHLPERSDRPGPLSLRFDIVDARIEHDSHGKFVVRTIFVTLFASFSNVLFAPLSQHTAPVSVDEDHVKNVGVRYKPSNSQC